MASPAGLRRRAGRRAAIGSAPRGPRLCCGAVSSSHGFRIQALRDASHQLRSAQRSRARDRARPAGGLQQALPAVSADPAARRSSASRPPTGPGCGARTPSASCSTTSACARRWSGCRREFDTESLPDALWQDIKLQYVGLLTNHRQPELAETFFNTVSCKLLHRTYYHNDFIFVRPAVSTEYLEGDPPIVSQLLPAEERAAHGACTRSCATSICGCPSPTRIATCATCCGRCASSCRAASGWRPNHQIQVLSSLFFRNQRAYLIGKIINGSLRAAVRRADRARRGGPQSVPGRDPARRRARSPRCSRSTAPT